MIDDKSPTKLEKNLAGQNHGSDEERSSPDSFFIFVVGVNDQWNKGRKQYGDIALVNQYLEAGVPEDQIVFVKDAKATRKRCRAKLEELLHRTKEHSTLLFYYGGHGSPTTFNTHEKKWRHRSVVESIDTHFRGDRVIVLADCCASGNFYRWLQLSQDSVVKHQYVCIMSTLPNTEAGAAWTLTASWLEAMKYNNGDLELSCLIDFMADEHARVKGDVMVVFLSQHVEPTSTNWLPKYPTTYTFNPLHWDRLSHNILQDARVTSHFSVGDCVYYKHPGGACPSDPSLYVPPVWLRGTIQSTSLWGPMNLLVQNSTSQHHWQVEASRRELLNDFFMSSTWMVPKKFFKVACKLAKKSKYLDCSMPLGTAVKIQRENGCKQEAVIADWKDFDWKAYLASVECNGDPPYGPYAIVRWINQDEGMGLIPLASMDVEDNFSGRDEAIRASVSRDDVDNQRAVMIKSINSFGKSVADAREVVGSSSLYCYWPEENIWYNGDAIDLSSVCLEVLASHAIFKLPGVYCPVLYDDGESYLIPAHYIRRRPVWGLFSW